LKGYRQPEGGGKCRFIDRKIYKHEGRHHLKSGEGTLKKNLTRKGGSRKGERTPCSWRRGATFTTIFQFLPGRNRRRKEGRGKILKE